MVKKLVRNLYYVNIKNCLFVYGGHSLGARTLKKQRNTVGFYNLSFVIFLHSNFFVEIAKIF